MDQYLPDKVNVNGEQFRIYLTQEEIQQRLKALGNQISLEYKDKRPIFIGVLNGAFISGCDALRHHTL